MSFPRLNEPSKALPDSSGSTAAQRNSAASESATKNVSLHRRSRGYTFFELAARVVWATLKPLFAFSPRLLYGWRNTLLRGFGAKIGKEVRIYPSVRVFAPWNLEIADQVTIGDRVHVYNVGRIRIGTRTMVSQNVHLCAGSHDYSSPAMALLRTPIELGSDVWICADAFVGPGVAVKNGAIVGARSAIFKDVDAETVVGGNPARMIKRRFANNDETANRRAA